MRNRLDRALALRALGAGAGYFVVARASLELAAGAEPSSMSWLAGGLFLGFLLRRAPGEWPLLAAAAFAADWLARPAGGPPALAAALSAVEVLEGLFGAWLLVRLAGPRVRLGSRREVLALVGVAGLVSGPASAALVALAQALAGRQGPWQATFLAAWGSGLLGAVCAAPAVLGWRSLWLRLRGRTGPQQLDAAFALALVAGVGWLAFAVNPSAGRWTLALLWAPLLPLLWAALRLGPGGVAWGGLAFAAIGVAFTLRGQGPLEAVDGDPLVRLLALQGYLSSSVLVGLLLAATLRELQRATDEVRAALERQRLIIEQTGRVLYDWDMVAGRAQWVGAVERVTGYTHAQLSALDFAGLAALVHPDDRPASLQQHLEAMGRCGRLSSVYRFRRGDGSWMWLENDGAFLPGPDGRATRMVGTVGDVSARHAAEEARLGAERQYRDIFDNATEGIFRSTPQGRLLVANPALAAMCGWASPEELVAAATDLGALLFEAPADHAELVRRVDEWGWVKGYEVRCRRRDGGLLWASFNARAVRGPDGKLAQVEGTLEDVTAQKRAEQERFLATERLRQIFEHSQESLFLVEGTADGSFVFEEVNGVMARRFGRPAEEIRGRKPEEIVPPEVARQLVELFRACVEAGAPFSAERAIDLPIGRRVTQVTLVPVRDRSGAIRRVAGASADVTQQRQAEQEKASLEEQLRKTQKMEALGTLAGGVAHDFNNILTAITANVDLLRLELPAGHPALESAGEIATAASRASDLVRRILAFSRQQEQARRPVQLAEVLAEVSRLLRAALPATIALQADPPAGLPLVVADASQIHQVLMNLAANAAYAMRAKGGTLQLALEAVQVTAQRAREVHGLREGAWVCLTVRDTGEGIAPGALEHVFEPFFTTKPVGEGTGLGLSVVHGIVRQHDGVVQVESEPGRGTTLRLWFPAAQGDAAAAEAGEEALPHGAGQRVLFVDDEPSLVRAGEGLLTRLGYRVAAHTRPEEALEALLQAPLGFDAVITDLTMPGMTGLELARRALEARPGLPILVATGFAGALTLDGLRAQGISDLVLKPFTAAGLSRALARALRPPGQA